jgi:hypothetical protein
MNGMEANLDHELLRGDFFLWSLAIILVAISSFEVFIHLKDGT